MLAAACRALGHNAYLWGRDNHDASIQELEQARAQVLVRQVCVLRQDISGEVEVLVLHVQQQQVAERLRRERRVLQQEVKLSEPSGGVVLHVHKRLVVQRDRVQLVLATRRHITQCFLRGVVVAEAVLNRRFQVEGFHQCRLSQDLRVADAADLNAICVAAHRQLRVLAHALLDNLCDVFQRRPVLFLAVVAQGDVVCQVGLVSVGGRNGRCQVSKAACRQGCVKTTAYPKVLMASTNFLRASSKLPSLYVMHA